jgi:uncharacterized protein YecT (DUF1311 family)
LLSPQSIVYMNFRKLLFIIVFVTCTFCTHSSVHGAGINCHALTDEWVEFKVCENRVLLDLDRELNEAYTLAIKKNKDIKKQLKSSQKKWLGKRNLCRKVDCIVQAYQSRIQALNDWVVSLPQDDEWITDKAFAVLLSMPGAEPQSGQWIFKLPKEFVDSGLSLNEKDLILWLQIQMDKGANFNSYRHAGTLLHHAIRSGLEDTAIWLIKNRADPNLKLKDYPYQNALDLSKSRNRMKVVAFLEEHVSKLNKISTRIEPTRKLTASKAMSNQWISLSPMEKVLHLLDRARVSNDQVEVHNNVFNALVNWFPNFNRITHAEINLLDAAFQKFDPMVLHRTLDDPQILGRYFYNARAEPEVFSQLLALIPFDLIDKHRFLILGALYRLERQDIYSRRPVVPMENWFNILSLIKSDLTSVTLPPLMSRTKPAVWRKLFDMNYQVSNLDTELENWLSSVDEAQIRREFELLNEHIPEFKEQVIRILFKKYTVNYGNRASCARSGISSEDFEKATWLINRGATAFASMVYPECDRLSAPGTLRALRTLGLIRSFEPNLHHAFDFTKTSCRYPYTQRLFERLYPKSTIGTDPSVNINSVMSIDLPGDGACGLLVRGDSPANEYPSDTINGFDGPYFAAKPSCPDPLDTAEVWAESEDGGFQTFRADDSAASIIAIVRDSESDEHFYVSYRPKGRCFISTNVKLLRWQKEGHDLSLKELQSNDPVMQRFMLFYNDRVTQKGNFVEFSNAFFPGLAISSDSYLDGGMLRLFLDANLSPKKQVFLQAVSAMEIEVIRQLEAEGLPPTWWVEEAIRSVYRSNLSIKDKYERIAYLMENQSIDVAGSFVYNFLLGLMPREQLLPIINRSSGYELGRFREKARMHGRERVACDAAHAMGLMCDEELQESR